MKGAIWLGLTALTLAGCGASPSGKSMVNEDSLRGESKTLIAYFSWSGNVEKLASWIKKYSGAEVYRIVPEDPYPTVYEEVADRARQEQEENIFPTLASPIDPEILKGYETVLLGYPVWWYNLPMSVQSFLKDNDFAGKTIIPFFSHAGSSAGAGSLDKIAELAPNSEFRRFDYLSVAGNDVNASESAVRSWVEGLGL